MATEPNVQNERTKLLAAALSNAGVATIITGLVAPAAAYLYGSGRIIAEHPWRIGLAGGRLGMSPRRPVRPGEAEMSGLELYLIIAPLALGVFGLAVGWWWAHLR
jgi:hypothetical protein